MVVFFFSSLLQLCHNVTPLTSSPQIVLIFSDLKQPLDTLGFLGCFLLILQSLRALLGCVNKLPLQSIA